ncbi:MAG TPA: TIGR02450 family Trp-rich protein [Limnobacter sp.]|uniref:TIGR02450 family Trp-rich protein n=1 Tax=Limnobacter sp. TaxID=2003368 RepID=UPI002EDB7866
MSKWTAVTPLRKEKHFIVSGVVPPDDDKLPAEQFVLEAVYSGNSQIIHWRELLDEERWIQGWK